MFSQKLERHRKLQKSFWLIYRECCGICEGGGFVENILADVIAVKREADSGGFRPDILLERKDRAPIWIEFTHTSPPTPGKLKYCAAHGIDLFELDGSRHPFESSVLKAYISPRNCRNRQRQRLHQLWQHIASLEDPKIGIREDFRSSERQQREKDARWAEAERKRQEAAEGRLRCIRCDEPFTIDEDGNLGTSFIITHRSEGICGEVPFCRECSFAITGGWDESYPDDADIWGLEENCPACQPFIEEQSKIHDTMALQRSLEMPGNGFRFVVYEPQRRTQSYIMGNQTVSRSELQSVLMMFQYFLSGIQKYPDIRWMMREVQEINDAVLFANNIRARDWLEGVGESFVAGSLNNSTGDKFLYPKRWLRELPPCPLVFLNADSTTHL